MKAALKKNLRVSTHPYESIPVVLVSGIGRSGTTALRHAMSAHPSVHSTGCENNIIYDIAETGRHNCTYWSRKGTMRVDPPDYDRQFRLLMLNLLWPEPRRGRTRPDALVATSDMGPGRADYFCQVFAGCRIPYIVRNGVEVLSSRMEHENFKDVPFEEHCQTWTRAYEMATWGAERDEFVLVKHEALVADPEATVSAALSACGLSFHQSCVAQVTEKTFHPTKTVAETTDASEDLRKRCQRWEAWRQDQRDTFAAICGDAMNYFGYRMEWTSS